MARFLGAGMEVEGKAFEQAAVATSGCFIGWELALFIPCNDKVGDGLLIQVGAFQRERLAGAIDQGDQGEHERIAGELHEASVGFDGRNQFGCDGVTTSGVRFAEGVPACDEVAYLGFGELNKGVLGPLCLR